jgi:DNA-binding transcriptional ArsR family regulator
MTNDMEFDIVKKWAPIFEIIGNKDRLSILLALHGSNYTRGGHCLTFSEIRNILDDQSESTLTYNLQKLLDADLIKKEPTQDKKGKGRVYPIYSITEKWINFTEESGLLTTLTEYLEKNGLNVVHNPQQRISK